MIKYSVIALLASIALLLTAPFAHASERGDLLAIEHEWVAATAQGDKSAIERILHDDFVDITAGGVIRRRSDVLAAAPLPAEARQALQDIEVRVYGKTAVITGVNVFRGSPSANHVEVVFTDVYIRQAGQWKAISSHQSIRTTR